MLLSLVKNVFRRGGGSRNRVSRVAVAEPIRLHIGGRIAHPEWKILDVLPGPNVDYVGHCTDLSAFDDESLLEIYSSHVIEHLGYVSELSMALREFSRVLVPGGTLRASVPDLTILCELFLDPALDRDGRFAIMRMMFGGQTNKADFHYVGLTEEFLRDYMRNAGFTDIARVDNFGLFQDTSCLLFNDRPISLNLCARKPGGV